MIGRDPAAASYPVESAYPRAPRHPSSSPAMSMVFRIQAGVLAGVAIVAVVSLSRLSRETATSSSHVSALLEAGRYEQAEVAARSTVASLVQLHGETSPVVAGAATELVRALRLNGKANLSETLELAERTVQATRKHFGDRHRATVASLLNLGHVLADRGEFDPAIATLQRALRACEQAGASELDCAGVLDAMGTVLTIARSFEAAVDVLERSLRIKERALSPDHIALRGTLETTVAALQGKGDYLKARERLDRAVAIGGHTAVHPSRVRSLNLLALQLWFEGDPLRSQKLSLEALHLARRTLRADHPEIARTLRVLAATIDDLGDMDGSRTYREQALAVARKSLGESHYEVASYLNDLGNLDLLLGAYAEARTLFDQALKIVNERLSPDHEWIPTLIHNLALVDARLGDFDGARRQQAQAIEMWERTLGPNHAFIAIALTELGGILREQGAAEQALPLFERALAIRQRALGAQHRDTALTLADIAAALSQMGQPDRAQQFASRALSVWEQTDTVDAPGFATVLALYARLQSSRGAFDDARRYFDRALAIRIRAFGVSHPDVAEIRADLALTLARLGNETEAYTSAVLAETSGREHLRLISRYLPERQALNYAANRPRALDLMLAIADTTESVSGVLDAVIRSRALVLDEMAARRRGSTANGDALDALRARLASAEQRLANLLVRGSTEQTSKQYSSLVDTATHDKEEAERALAARSASFREQRNQAQSGLAEVRAGLPADAAMVSFVLFSRPSRTPGAARGSSRASGNDRGLPEYAAIVLRPGRDPVLIHLEPASVIEDLVSRWRAEVAAAAGSGGDGVQTPALLGIGRQLRAAVWEPIAGHLAGARMIFVVPDGALSLVPLMALPGHQAEFLIDETPAVHHLSAERDIVVPTSGRSARRLLALGGADFDSRGLPSTGPAPPPADVPMGSSRARGTTGNCVRLGGLQFPPLSDTLAEVNDIAGLWSPQKPPVVEDVRVLSGAHADERTFKREAHGYRVLHLATHGFFLGGPCQPRSAAATRSVGGLVPSLPAATDAETENPLLLSGLAMAGANRRANTDLEEDDGILTAEEVASLNLENTEWAVLSACDTGVGEIKAGEGVFGLRRAFRIAGARTVIMSLWSVDDQATRQWMRALYDGRLNRHLNTAQAVHEASLSVLRDRRARGQSTHPFYWAAFVAAGDWH